MASGGQHAPQNSASEVRSSRCPGKSSHERLGEMALRCPLPPRPWNVSLSAAIRKSFSEACLRDALRLPAPSWTRSVRGVMRARPAAGPDPAAARGPPPAPSTQPPVPSPPRLMQKTWGGFPDQRRLLAYLTQAQGREARLWRGGQLQAEIGEAFREVVLWLLSVENIFDFSQTTFNLALTIFSRLIVSVKIKKHLLHCVTITSLRLATKVNEEEELIPRIKDFIKHYGSGYSPNELLRMELAILDRLHWDLYMGTPLDFLSIVSTRNFQSLPWTHCAFGTAVHNIGRQSTRP
ncbi:cyclin-I2 isoform X1 [Ovis aries]|uniref:cyclin-I2 isoform X1 n=1 Tax=Ovis aries TaxID=9940 RepID=UPI001C2E443A|nr:cyclin-I2 isoform X1 [Ovis aries]